jgi:hypothetical protein
MGAQDFKIVRNAFCNAMWEKIRRVHAGVKATRAILYNRSNM